MRNLLFLLFFIGCNGNLITTVSSATIIRATCYLNDFKGFPEKVTGPVSLELKNFLTIVVENKKKTEKVEITFPKSKCKVI